VNEHFDILVIGAGPAGISAAVTAGEHGARVAVVDESPRIGGQFWHGPIPRRARRWFDRLRETEVVLHGSTSVIDTIPGRVVTTAGAFHCERIILACGARELMLPFPGWTLPGVTGAGALQALVHDGLDVSGQCIVVAGTGPLLFQVAAQIRRRGARVVRVAEQAPLGRLIRFAAGLPLAKKIRALRLASIRFRASSWVEAAHGATQVERVVLRTPGGCEQIDCDRLAVGFSLVPNVELARHLGCRIRDGAVHVDERQRTSVEGVLAAGEVCGVKGAEGALLDGRLAAFEALGLEDPGPSAIHAERDFGGRLKAAFALRPEIKSLADDDTIFCRCEDISFGEVRAYESWTSAKILTRCGMGHCQGRVCGSAAQSILGWGPSGSRPPLVPIPIGQLMNERTRA
jgi:NADPH-dependent 2,4-dienoyl-CoA reductase/sulfur reductase-like enzyme